jgi:hypothetical protein
MSTVNGWINMLNLGNFGADYNTRGFIAFAGLGALTKVDALYLVRSWIRRARLVYRAGHHLRRI